MAYVPTKYGYVQCLKDEAQFLVNIHPFQWAPDSLEDVLYVIVYPIMWLLLPLEALDIMLFYRRLGIKG